MQITFYGAAGEVTGSCTLVESGDTRVLVDCGAFQGGYKERIKNNSKFPFDAAKVDALVLTHAHYDHCGRIPKLVAAGFKGPIFTTEATAHLVKLILEDSLRVMENDYQKSGLLPFFNEEHLALAMKQIKPVKYGQKVNSRGGVSFALREADHVLGSASVELYLEDKTVLFSGDLGNDGAPIMRDTNMPEKADVVIMESTYAMREHEARTERVSKLEQALLYTHKHRGVLLIPAFALERTQEVLWDLHRLSDLHKLPGMPFYLDSPLAIKITDEFRHHPDVFDAEAVKAYKMHHDFLSFPNLHITLTSDESKAINSAPAPKVIIAGSGMMDGGRIMHHLKRYLPLPNTTILVVGYQSVNSTGRRLLNGEKAVRIDGWFIPVHAKIIKADSFSAHADYNKLIKWVTSIRKKPTTIFLNHGEMLPAKEFANFLKDKYDLNTQVPRAKQTFKIV